MDRLAGEGDGGVHRFPRPKLNDDSYDFSFSGLKTSVRYFVRDNPGVLESGRQLQDLCAGVQAAIVEVLVKKTMRAAKRLGVGASPPPAGLLAIAVCGLAWPSV